MAFTENIKLEVKKAGHFSCCICHSPGVEIHHLIPQCENGPDTFENAAPLCPSCHETYGGNPTKKKFITEARDFWYEICDKRYAPSGMSLSELENRISSSMDEQFSNVKKMLEENTKNTKNAIAVGKSLNESEVVHYLVTKYYKEDTRNTDLFDCIWNDDDFPEIRLRFQRRYGDYFFQITCKHVIDQTNMDLNCFTEEDYGEAASYLRLFAIIMCLLSDGDIEAEVMPDGEFSWRATP